VRAPPLTPLAAAVLHVPIPERALAIADSDGEATLFLAREFPAARIRGVDASTEQIRKIGSRVGLDPEGRVAFKVGKPGDLPYPEAFFDLVVQVAGRPAATEIVRVLRPGGHLILARTHLPRLAASAREGLLRKRLARHGVVALHQASAGDGKFFVGQLDRPG